MSERTRRLDHLLREEISLVLRREISDPRIGFVTITGVDVSPDLRHATVWASIIGDSAERRTSLRALERAMPYVRHHLGGLRLKRIPELRVREDDSAQRGTRVMELLERLGTQGEEAAADPEALTRELEARDLPKPGPLPTWPEAEPADAGTEAAAVRRGRARRADRASVRKARERRGR